MADDPARDTTVDPARAPVHPWCPATAGRSRGGTILIIVAGISAMLASLSLTFLLRIRAGAESMELLAQETQARLMLHAACAYIMESSRIGYGPSRSDALLAARDGRGFVSTSAGTLAHREAFGWIDVRESDGTGFANPGQPGPRDQRGTPLYAVGSGKWPDVGGVVMCPMHRWTRPPYAISPQVAANPILNDPARTGDPRWGRPVLSNPDPQPAIANGWPGTVSDANWGDFVTGEAVPVGTSVGVAWFRVRRASAATFIVTVGAGGTMGFKDWDEVVGTTRPSGAPGGAELFGNDRGLFESLRIGEIRNWYEVRWSAAVRPLDFRHEEAVWWGRWLQNAFAYRVYPVNGSQYTGWGRSNRFNPNPVGTISYIQRLEARGDGPVRPVSGEALPW